MKFKLAVAVLGAALCVASPGWATTITYDFSACPTGFTCPTAIGTSQTYTAGGVTITAYGFNASGADNLYVKEGSGDESGLGLADGGTDHEIKPGSFVQLDLSNLAAKGVDSGTLTIGSVQKGEAYDICTSTAIGTLGTSCTPGTTNFTPVTISWSSSDPIVGLTATNGDVLLVNSMTTEPTPEPGTVTLLGAGALMLAAMMFRRFRSSAASC